MHTRIKRVIEQKVIHFKLIVVIILVIIVIIIIMTISIIWIVIGFYIAYASLIRFAQTGVSLSPNS